MKHLNLDRLNAMARAVREGEEFIPGCTGKVAYFTGREANEAAAARKAKTRRNLKLSVYKCTHCTHFHMTSHPVRRAK